jgi:hypothetical protein
MEEEIEIPQEHIDKGIAFIQAEYKYFTEKKLYIEEVEGVKEVVIEYPGDDAVGLSYEAFDSLAYELQNFKLINNGRFHTTWCTYQIINFETEDIQYYLLSQSNFSTEFELGIIRILSESDILRFASMKLGVFHEDYGTFHQHYPVIEIQYEDKRNKLSLDQENELILSYLFEIGDTTGYNISISKFIIPKKEIRELIEQTNGLASPAEDNSNFKLKPLINYNEGMELYVSALQINDESLRFLNFYKIMEYFAPIIIRMEGNSLLVSKLDNPKALSPDRKFVDSIFDLVNSVNENQRDSELAKSVLRKIDFIDCFSLLPERVAKHALGQAKLKNLNYNTLEDKVSIIINVVATALYSTRNKVVHAKSNYVSTGTEFNNDELEQLNIFMRQATAKLIRWYNKLPKHQR